MPAPSQAKKVAMIGSLDHLTRQLMVHTSPTKRASDFIAHTEQLHHLYGPQPGRAMTSVVLVEDNGPIHVSKLALAAIEARKHWLAVEWLPKYAPGTQRHRGGLARSQDLLSRAPDLPRHTGSRSCHPRSRRRLTRSEAAVRRSIEESLLRCWGRGWHDANPLFDMR